MNNDLDHNQSQRKELLTRTNQLANEFLDGVADRPVARSVEFETLLSEISSHGIPADGDAPMMIIEQLQSQRLSKLTSPELTARRWRLRIVGGGRPVINL